MDPEMVNSVINTPIYMKGDTGIEERFRRSEETVPPGLELQPIAGEFVEGFRAPNGINSTLRNRLSWCEKSREPTRTLHKGTYTTVFQ